MVPWGTVDRSAFRIVRGELHEVRSSHAALRGFCGACGTSVSYQHEAKPDELDVALATLDDLEAVRPECHLWVEDKPSWLAITDGLPQFARSRDGGRAEPPRSVRPGYAAISARIVVDDAAPLVEFVKHVFRAGGEYADGLPSELRIADSTLLVSESGPRSQVAAFLYVYVASVEDTHARALQRGARELEAPQDTPYGDRRSMFADRWGNTWQVASYQR